MAFCWRADDSPLIVVFGWFLSLPHQLKTKQTTKKHAKVGPSLTKLSGSAHVTLVYLCISTVWFEHHRHMVIKVEDTFSRNVVR